MRRARVTTGRSRSTDAREFTPDLVILDLGLPKIDGVDVARTLRRTAATSRSSC